VDINAGWALGLTGAMLVLVTIGGLALWRTTRFR
jgi:hypothetical protein